VVLLRLVRPPVNALDLELVQAIDHGVTAAVKEGARAIVLTGAGSCFQRRHRHEARTYLRRPAAQEIDRRDQRNARDDLLRAAAVARGDQRPCIRRRLVIALACDLRLAARGDYQLSLNEIAAGVPFPAGPLGVVRAELDPSVLRDLCLTGAAWRRSRRWRCGSSTSSSSAGARRPSARARARARRVPAYAVVKAQVRGPLIAELEQIVAPREGPRCAKRAGLTPCEPFGRA